MTIRRVDRGAYHWYEDENGQRVPSVTSIQRKAIPKQDILLPWAGRVAGEYVLDNWDALVASKPSDRYKAVSSASRKSNSAAKIRGTKVHALGVAVAAGEEVSVPAELVGYVEAYTKFLFDYDAHVFMSEAVAWSKTHGHVGTLDTGADLLIDGRRELWLLDNKTGSGVYDETAFQLAGYRYADVWIEYPPNGEPIEHTMPNFERCGVVHIREDGYALIPVEVTEETYRGFLYLQASAAAIEANKGSVGSPLEPPVREEF